MTELSSWIDSPGFGGVSLALFAALVLGLRHATEPDHLTAVAALVLGGARGGNELKRGFPAGLGSPPVGARGAGLLGLTWGIGHAVAFLLLGLPVVLLELEIPAGLQGGAEVVIGLMIVLLAVRLIVRWRRGAFRIDPLDHPDTVGPPATLGLLADGYVQPIEGVHPSARHRGGVEQLGRSPLAAFGMGILHGIGGSAAVGIFIVAGASDQGEAVLALTVFAAATAISMSAVSGIVGGTLAQQPVTRRLESLVPTLGFASAAFGVWYALAATLGLLSNSAF